MNYRESGLCITAFLLLAFVCQWQPGLAAAQNLQEVLQDVKLRPQIAAFEKSYRLSEAMQIAIRNFPTLRYAGERINATRAGVTLAKTAYLPSFDLLVQEMRVTDNVIAGTIFPQVLDVIPIQSGRPTSSSSFSSVWASNMGANFSWELYDFGLRHSNVLLAKSDNMRARADLSLTQLDVAAAAAEAYLQTVEHFETIRAQRATVSRMEAWQLVVDTLVDKGLRPGVDKARAGADVASARITLIQTEQETELARVDLAETMGMAGSVVHTESQPWIKHPINPFSKVNVVTLADHPLAILKSSDVKVAESKVHVLDRTWYPHLYFHSVIWGRGSGVPASGIVAGGIMPQSANYVAGLSMDFPVLDYYEIKARRRMAYHDQLAQKANYDLAIQVLAQKSDRAQVLLTNSQRIAAETPYLVENARENEKKALERYRVGLTNIVEVAEAERILANAEMQDAVAQVRVWRAILATAYAQGDLKPFITIVRQAEALN